MCSKRLDSVCISNFITDWAQEKVCLVLNLESDHHENKNQYPTGIQPLGPQNYSGNTTQHCQLCFY